ncbi:glycosyltransferase family 39 protein [Limosilactobacillus ingluviei]|uniref:Glycosyltransferase RgtA/B/C/D-like domain-containing protein n=1 Tax=Limosilactobacillus ingluviei TaxID=148604 RepID=A0A0R2GTN0_9LACO|nr:glycosyltransferase family 39 protein [Limosilactobacillus ingluviei]KRN44128.1 hypothetical protein IV41_GL000826 [Limosilactobacillus ingluviei]
MTKNKLERVSNFVISILLYSLIVISIMGGSAALVDDLKTSTNHTVALAILVTMIGIICFLVKFNAPSKLKKIKNLKRLLLILIVVITITWQFNLVFALSGRMGWDPAITSYVSTNRSLLHTGLSYDYFSYYPNNFLIVAVGRLFWKFLNLIGYTNYSNFVFGSGIVNYILIDFSILLLYSAIKIFFNQRIAFASSSISLIMIGLSPVNVIPYTDTFAYFIGVVLIYLLSKFLETESKKNKIIFMTFLGVIAGFGYYIKPTTLIFTIALGLVAVVNLINIKRKDWKFLAIVVIAFGSSFISTSFIIKSFQYDNNIIKIDKRKTFPVNHFIAMGMEGSGGYSSYDVIENIKIKNPVDRRKFNSDLIKKRLKEKGTLGYLKFLVIKQINNTANGTFGWGLEGGYLYSPFKEKSVSSLQKIQRKIFMTKGRRNEASPNWNGHKLLIQMIWVSVLFSTMLSLRSEELRVQLFKLCVLGGLIFLLFFEGGRSRYLIQFLPFFFTLSGIGIEKMMYLRSKN